MTMKKLENFVPFPRQDLADLHDGKLTPNEYDLYVRTRHSANPYGIATVSLKGLVSDFFHRSGWTENYLNKLMLSLKSKGYIHYDKRSGRRGSFSVRFANFSTPKGGITTLSGSETPMVKGEGSGQPPAEAEDKPSLPSQSQKSVSIKESTAKLVKKFSLSQGRGTNTDNDTYKENNHRFYKKGTPVNTFRPQSHEEQRCQEIAVGVGEETMDFLLSVLRRHGIRVLEETWDTFRLTKQAHITNKPAYFNALLHKRLK